MGDASGWRGGGLLRAAMAAGLALVALETGRTAQGLPERCLDLERELDGLLERAAVPGISIACAAGRAPVWTAARGVRDARTQEPVDAGTVFEAASLSKPVFAYAVLQLVDEGLLELDQPLAQLFPYADAAHDPRYEKITTRMLLAHTGGFPNWRPNGGSLDLRSDPGAAWRYSGEGFVFLQRTLEELTGATIQETCHSLVFEPLGMKRSSFVWEERFEANHAVPHDPEGGARDKNRPGFGNAAWSLLTTANDYARFLCALMRGENLGNELRAELMRPQSEVAPDVSWGLGVGLETRSDGPSLWHWGHNGGFRAYCLAYPARDEALVFFTNSDNGMLLLRELLHLATGDETHPAADHLDYDTLPALEIR